MVHPTDCKQACRRIRHLQTDASMHDDSGKLASAFRRAPSPAITLARFLAPLKMPHTRDQTNGRTGGWSFSDLGTWKQNKESLLRHSTQLYVLARISKLNLTRDQANGRTDGWSFSDLGTWKQDKKSLLRYSTQLYVLVRMSKLNLVHKRCYPNAQNIIQLSPSLYPRKLQKQERNAKLSREKSISLPEAFPSCQKKQ